MDERKVILEIQSLSKSYPLPRSFSSWISSAPLQMIHAVHRVSLSIYSGETVGLIGESGCGKTTLGQLICCLLKPSSGKISLLGRELTGLSSSALRPLRQTFQLLFQNPYSTLNPKMNVFSILKETLVVNSNDPLSEIKSKIQEMLDRIGLADKEEAYPFELSGGERRRVGLARLLLLKPALIVADEPVAGLDASIKFRMIDLMMKTRAPEMSYLFISHDLPVIRYVSDRVFVMYLGRVIEEVPNSKLDGQQNHPYTVALLQASDRLLIQKKNTPSDAIGFLDLPSHNEHVGTGCLYMPRCPWVGSKVKKDRCLREEPRLFEVSKGHRIACHFFQDKQSS